MSTRPTITGGSHELNPEKIHFGTDISVYAADGSGSVRVRVHFGRTNPLSTLDFNNVVLQKSGQFRIVMMFMFRDRLGRRPDRENAKIIPLQIFNLQDQQTSVRLSVNQWVPGSSPGRGANFFFQINHLRPEHRRLLVFWSTRFMRDKIRRRSVDS